MEGGGVGQDLERGAKVDREVWRLVVVTCGVQLRALSMLWSRILGRCSDTRGLVERALDCEGR